MDLIFNPLLENFYTLCLDKNHLPILGVRWIHLFNTLYDWKGAAVEGGLGLLIRAGFVVYHCRQLWLLFDYYCWAPVIAAISSFNLYKKKKQVFIENRLEL